MIQKEMSVPQGTIETFGFWSGVDFSIKAPDFVLAVTRETTFWIPDSGVC